MNFCDECFREDDCGAYGCCVLSAQESACSALGRERVALANADYEDRRREDRSHRLTLKSVEREWKLLPGQLVNYRANRKKRKDGGVTIFSELIKQSD